MSRGRGLDTTILKERCACAVPLCFVAHFGPPRFSVFSAHWEYFPSFNAVLMSDMTGETSKNVSSFDCVSFVVLLKHL